MRKRLGTIVVFAVLAAIPVSAHLMISPTQSKTGTVQKYELRVHNEAKVAATSVDLEIPEGVAVTEVAKPATGTYTTKKAGDRITTITWQVEVQPGKYVALPFTAKNPESATELHWNMREHLADGSVVEWSDKPGAKEKGAVTKLAAAS
jgi:uncharacterized protein YcnI